MIEIPFVTAVCLLFCLICWTTLVAGFAASIGVDAQGECSCEERIKRIESMTERIEYNVFAQCEAWDVTPLVSTAMRKRAGGILTPEAWRNQWGIR